MFITEMHRQEATNADIAFNAININTINKALQHSPNCALALARKRKREDNISTTKHHESFELQATRNPSSAAAQSASASEKSKSNNRTNAILLAASELGNFGLVESYSQLINYEPAIIQRAFDIATTNEIKLFLFKEYSQHILCTDANIMRLFCDEISQNLRDIDAGLRSVKRNLSFEN